MKHLVSTDNSEPAGPFAAFASAVAADFRSASAKQMLALVLVVAMMIFEWGPGNETVVVTTLASVSQANQGIAGIFYIGVVGFLLVFCLQLLSGSIALVGFSMLDRTSEAAWNGLAAIRGDTRDTERSDTRDTERSDWWSLSLRSRMALSFFVGCSAVALLQQVVTGKSGLARHWRVIAQSAVLAGLSTAMLAMFLATAAYIGRQFPATEQTANQIVALAANPLTWIGIFVVVLIGNSLKKRSSIKKRSSVKSRSSVRTRPASSVS